MRPSTAQIWEEFGPRLLGFIQARVDNRDDAEDLLQDVFVKIHTRLETLQDEERLAPWVYQVTRNTITDYYRSRKPSQELPESLPVEMPPVESQPVDQIAAGLRGLVNCLPEKYRQALLLSEFEGLKQQEVAERLDLSLSGAKSRVQRGRDLLRDELLDCCHFEFDRRGHMIDYTPRPACCRHCS